MQVEIADVKISRYEKALFELDLLNLQEELQGIATEFRPFLDADLSDSLNILRIAEFVGDSLIRSLYVETLQAYPDLEFLEEDLTLAFRHIKYYFPDWHAPDVYSYVSGLIYEAPVKYSGSELIIALDMYLGVDFELYRMIGIPLYQINRMIRERIIVDCVNEIVRGYFMPGALTNNMLDKMIEEGKVFYLMDRFIPWIADKHKIGFTPSEINWCSKNETNMWAYFIENDLLFNSDPAIINRFINDGPFTAAFQRESPARAAVWVGWQIVRTYMGKNRDKGLEALIAEQDARYILRASGYKPRRFGFR